MAPLPKKRHAKSRTRTRKSTKKISLPQLVTCPKCSSLKFPHMACKNCGFYREPKLPTPTAAKKDENQNRS